MSKELFADMSLKLIDVTSPEFSFIFQCPFPGGVHSGDKLSLQVDMESKSSLLILLKSNESHNGSPIPFGLSLTLDENELKCKWGENDKWEERQGSKIVERRFYMSLTVTNNWYRVLINGDTYAIPGFNREYPPFEADTLEIRIPKRTAVVKSISITRQLLWLEAKIGSPIPELAFKCGKDVLNNDIYLGRCYRWNTMMFLSVNPARKTATTVVDGNVLPVESYELLADSGNYDWISIGEDIKIPKNAILYEKYGWNCYIGRAKYEGSVIPGTIYKEVLSIPFKGKEVKISSGYEVLVALSQLEVQKKQPKEIVTPPEHKCIICCMNEKTTAFIPCGHMGFCESCAKKLLKQTKNCAICKKDVTSHLRIYKV